MLLHFHKQGIMTFSCSLSYFEPSTKFYYITQHLTTFIVILAQVCIFFIDFVPPNRFLGDIARYANAVHLRYSNCSVGKFIIFVLGKPTFQKSAVFLNIVQKAFDPPPPLFEHLSYFAGGVF